MAGLSEGVVEKFTTVTKSDDTVLQLRGFFVGTAGNVVIKGLDGVEVTLKNCPSGSYYPFAVSRIMAATTAADIVGLV